MNFETTTCISKEHYILLCYYSEKYNVKLSKLITALLRFVGENQKVYFTTNRRIKYRERQGGNWKRIHIMLTPYDYEIILDLKKYGKMSLAKMIEFSIENYFERFVNRVLKKQSTDNYLYANYHFEVTTENNIFSYSVYWGLPPKILQKLTKTTHLFSKT
ncbi:MAG: hypothetical protein GYA16_03620 [Spirochaetes bacterium]|nr:hypothetical protein [Spirochaetota bacterium]